MGWFFKSKQEKALEHLKNADSSTLISALRSGSVEYQDGEVSGRRQIYGERNEFETVTEPVMKSYALNSLDEMKVKALIRERRGEEREMQRGYEELQNQYRQEAEESARRAESVDRWLKDEGLD